jgi:serine/threonine-protein kinase
VSVAKRKRTPPSAAPPSAAAPRPRGAWLALAIALAAASAAWALHLWRQLALARGGAAVTCPFDAEGDCAAVWQSGFAAAVEQATGLPIAAHGVLWSLVALALPAAVLAARVAGRRGDLAWAGTLAAAAAGIVAVIVLAAAQLADGRFCGSCGVTYALALAYAGACLAAGARPAWGRLARGGLLAGAAAALGFAGLALGVPAPPPPQARSAPLASAAGPAYRDLESFLASLAPPVAQALAETLREYGASPPVALSPPRALLGSAMAPVRITDFADLLCSHCAALHATLAQIRRSAPEGSVSIESRYFPLDGACNPRIARASEDRVRCTAARVLICLEGDPGAFELAGELYARQGELDADLVYSLAARLRPRAELEACAASPATEAELQGDIASAAALGIQGTPFVLVNGRRASGFPAFLWALVLAGGDAGHPSFAALPSPKPKGG